MYEEENDLISNNEFEEYNNDQLLQQEEITDNEQYAPPEDNRSIGEKAADTAGQAVETAGEAVETAGAAVETTGAAVETAGKTMETTGAVAEVSGRGLQVTGKALDAAGQGINSAGAALDSTGVGAVVGVGLNVIGTGMSVLGKGADATGQATEKAGTGIKKTGQTVEKTGKNIKKQGKNIKKKGNEIQKKGRDIGNKFNKKNQYVHKKRTLPLSQKLNGKSNLGLNNGKFTMKMPKKIKLIFIVLLISIPIFLLMFFVVLFGDEDQASSSSGIGSAQFAYGKTCTTVTVTDTGCNNDGKNCTNEYDGEIELEDYIAGVVAAEAGSVNNLEYYKVSAINARTYYLANTNDKCSIKGNVNEQKYMNADDSSNAELIKQAVEETKDLVIVKKNKIFNIDKNVINQTEALTLITSQNYTYEDVIKHYHGQDVEIKENTMQLPGINGFVNPTRYIVCSSAYGNRIHPVEKVEKFHSGIDIGVSGGEPIYAANEGTISTVVSNVTAINNCDYGYGNYIIIDHDDGGSTVYAHIKYGTIPSTIAVGEKVSKGEQIGQVGSTGCSTGNHLHYEVRVNGQTVDPADYLDLTEATGTCKR